MSSWWLTSEPGPSFKRPDGRRPDVEIVGAGVTGCSCALSLARQGARVRVYDAREVAGGASGRNGGFALRGGAQPYDRAVESLGRDAARDYWRLTEDALERFAAVAGDALRRTGSLRLAVDEEERDELRAEFEALRADGFAAEWRDELPPPLAGRFAAALFHPSDASTHPARAVRRLAQAAADAGADIVEHHRVAAIDDLDAEHVVVASDGYPSGLLGELQELIAPTRGQVIATEPIPERLFEMPHYSRHGYDYWQQLEDGRIVAGGFRDLALETEFTDVEETTPAIQAALEDFVADLVGRQVAVAKRWAGIFGTVRDFLPLVGRHPEDGRVWVAAGYSGHGNVLGFASGALVAEALIGREHPLLAIINPGRLVHA
jgi:glycine/D-amino acid oxidase-like deaminating enzyme